MTRRNSNESHFSSSQDFGLKYERWHKSGLTGTSVPVTLSRDAMAVFDDDGRLEQQAVLHDYEKLKELIDIASEKNTSEYTQKKMRLSAFCSSLVACPGDCIIECWNEHA